MRRQIVYWQHASKSGYVGYSQDGRRNCRSLARSLACCAGEMLSLHPSKWLVSVLRPWMEGDPSLHSIGRQRLTPLYPPLRIHQGLYFPGASRTQGHMVRALFPLWRSDQQLLMWERNRQRDSPSMETHSGFPSVKIKVFVCGMDCVHKGSQGLEALGTLSPLVSYERQQLPCDQTTQGRLDLECRNLDLDGREEGGGALGGSAVVRVDHPECGGSGLVLAS
ncbi:hypothetical protein BDP81DRAFT_5770 [Colletotrichum phormii]|uniref:Uncharacterized protein n=1 Tax=Colletotrichum phormii TaxID=359342 RepID=A0AAJ0A311_9PEZI|nr:uncharacterized protein BDP81DRAFT_5770 [Colletotrichum phormii]KAK1655542.1 hypothetical protein BDP81DRAFT_5770 [Colletotrichum phormii]